jgi:perosamine synthetase
MFYRQMPARSPIPASALPGITLQSIAVGGDPRDELQSLLLERYRAHGGRLLGSGTQSLQTALELATADRNEPVLLPAYSCYEVASAAVGANVRAALYDVDPNTLEPDWDSVRAAAANGVSALVVAPLYGLPLDWDQARAVADALGALLIADVAQAHGTEWRGQPAGTNADMTVLSFGRGKGWTGAGGGALLWRGDAARQAGLRAATSSQRHQFVTEAKSAAKAGSQWLLGRRSLYGLPASIPFLKLGETIYHDPSSPVGMTRTSAALVLASQAEACNEVLHRRRNAQRYSEWLETAVNRIESVPGKAMNDEAGALRYPLRLRSGWAALARTDAPRLGAARGYPAPLRELNALRKVLVNDTVNTRGAELLAREVVTLPTHSQMAEREMRRLVELVSEVG